MIRQLKHKETGKTYTLYLEDKLLTTQTGSRKTEKKFGSKLEAVRATEKKEWEKLKKGFVFTGLQVEAGEAYFHQYIGRAYTGCLSMVDLDNKIGVYRHQNFDADLLDVFDFDGNFKETIQLPNALPWQLAYLKEHQLLIMDVDHYIYCMDSVTHVAAQWTNHFDEPGSFIAAGKSTVFYGAAPHIFLKDVSSNTLLFTKELSLEMFAGHSTVFTGCLSEDAQLLAVSTKPGVVEILNTTGEVLQTIKGNFQLAKALAFLDNDTLLIHEQYGTWGLRLVDLKTGTEIEGRIHKEETTLSKYVDSFDLDLKNNRLVISNRATVTLYELPDFKPVLTFPVAHCVKRAEVVFAGDQAIGVRTDYGCFSLYLFQK